MSNQAQGHSAGEALKASVVLSSGILQPHLDGIAEGLPKTHPLSIIDCTVVKFAATGAVWFYDPPTTPLQSVALSTPTLLASLQRTIDSYPEWAGQIHWVDFDPTNTHGHGRRYGRCAVTVSGKGEGGDGADEPGTTMGEPSEEEPGVQSRKKGSSNPGLHYAIHSHSQPLSTYLPSPHHRFTPSFTWDVQSRLPSHLFLPQEKVAFHSGHDFWGRPLVVVQITRFGCGSLGVGVKVCHAVADATSLMTFMHDWAAVSRAIVLETSDHSQPRFSPPRRFPSASVIDSLALGDIDASIPDPDLIAQSRALLMHRYSWWDSSQGASEYFKPSTVMPKQLEGYPAPISPGEPMPWAKWEVEKPVQHYALHFTAEEIGRMWTAACDLGNGQTQRVSKLDALQAHIWGCIMRARGIEPDEEVHIDMSFGFRARLGLEPDHLGSPLRLCYATASGSLVQPSDIAHRSRLIRNTLQQFTKPALQAVLHDLAHEASAQRIWATFLGRGNTLVSSWARIGVYDLDFGGGVRPTYVDSLMPACDGMLQIMEAAPYARTGPVTDDGHDWLIHGLDIAIYLQEAVMEKFLADRQLRLYTVKQDSLGNGTE